MRRAASAATREAAAALLEEAFARGSAYLRSKLRTLNPLTLSWASTSCPPMRPLLIFAMYEFDDFSSRNPDREQRILSIDDPEMLDTFEKRGFDARALDAGRLAEALAYPRTLAWLDKRTDITASIRTLAPHGRELSRVLSSQNTKEVCLRTLAAMGHHELVAHTAPLIFLGAQAQFVRMLAEKKIVTRLMCVRDGGVVLRAIMSRKRTKRQMRRILEECCGLSPSDFASAGL